MKTKTENPTRKLLNKLHGLGYSVNYSVQYKGNIFTLVWATAEEILILIICSPPIVPSMELMTSLKDRSLLTIPL